MVMPACQSPRARGPEIAEAGAEMRDEQDLARSSTCDQREKKLRHARPRHQARLQRQRGDVSPSQLQYAEEKKRARVDRTSVLAAFCPREVLYRFQSNCKRLEEPLVMDAHECVVLWIDICKFTRLAEKMSPKMLGHALTDIFSIMIELVTLHGGDVVKFCGDALLCTFRDAQKRYAQEAQGVDAAICAACKCAQAIQATPFLVQSVEDPSRDPVGTAVHLQVKTCVAKGKIHAMLVGGAYDRWEYLVVGQPLQDLRAADAICGPGETVVTQDVRDRLVALAKSHQGPILRCAANPGKLNDGKASKALTALSTFQHQEPGSMNGTPRRSPAPSQRGRTFSFTDEIISASSQRRGHDFAVSAATDPEAATPHVALSPSADGPLNEDPGAVTFLSSVGPMKPIARTRRRPNPLDTANLESGEVADLGRDHGCTSTAIKLDGAYERARSPKLRCVTSLDLPVPSVSAAAGQARRLTPRHRVHDARRTRTKSSQALPQWKPFAPSPCNAQAIQVPRLGANGGELIEKTSHGASCDKSCENASHLAQASPTARDHYVLEGGHAWFQREAPLLPSNATLDLSAIHNAAVTRARGSTARPKARSRDEEHPLSAFVPFQVRHRLDCLDEASAVASIGSPSISTSPASSPSPIASPRNTKFCSEAFWQDPSFAEMRHVTVLFIKLHGLTDRGFETDAGLRLAKSIHRSLVVIQGSLYRYGGMLRQMLCDDKGTVAIGVFGVPGAPNSAALRQDDVSFALVAALEIQEELATRRDIADCRVSIGVATGRAFCGIIGSQQRAEYSIVGDTVNTAARIMEATGPEDSRFAVACDAQTRADCKDSDMICFDERRDVIEVKNKAKAVILSYPRLRTGAGNAASPALDPRATPVCKPAAEQKNSAASVRLVGQDLASAAIQSLLKSQSHFAHRQINQVMLLQGGPGSGKSAILSYAASQHRELEARRRDPTAACAEPSAPLEIRLYELSCKSPESPLRALFAQILCTTHRDWISKLVNMLEMRASSLVGYIELLGDVFPEERRNLASVREAAGHGPLWIQEGSVEREGALWAFLARLVQIHHVFRPGVLCVDDLHIATQGAWRWFLVLLSTCCLRQVDNVTEESCGGRSRSSLDVPLSFHAKRGPSSSRSPQRDIERPATASKASPKRGTTLHIDTSPRLFEEACPSTGEDTFSSTLDLPELLPVTAFASGRQLRRKSAIPNLSPTYFTRRSCAQHEPALQQAMPARLEAVGDLLHAAGPLPLPLDSEPRASRYGRVTRRKRRSAVLREGGTPTSLRSVRSQQASWAMLDDSRLNEIVMQYGAHFGIFDAGPSTLLSVVIAASAGPRNPFEAEFVALLKRHHAMGRVPLRIIQVRPLSMEDASTLASLRFGQLGRHASVKDCEALARQSAGNPARLVRLIHDLYIF